MILLLAVSHRKTIAGFLSALTYMQFLSPLLAQGESTNSRLYHSKYSRYSFVNSQNANSDFSNTVAVGSERKQEAVNAAVAKSALTSIKEASPRNVDFSGGPGQPEASSFKSVNESNMVDLFTGDFSYNIPLLDVGGYPVNIHYNSGITMDQEASWVGLGFNLNPGSITRNMRGLPDDFNGTDSISKTQSIKTNQTTGVTIGGQAEVFGFPLSVGASLGVFHNNYNGWGIEHGINASISLGKKTTGALNGLDSGSVSLGLGINNNSQTGLSVSPSLDVKLMKLNHDQVSSSGSMGLSTMYHTRGGISALSLSGQSSRFNGNMGLSFAQPSVIPTISMPTTSHNYVFHLKTGGEYFGFHGNLYVEGYVNRQEIKDKDKQQLLPAYGYLYFSNAKLNNSALLDFNREKDIQFNYKSTPNIAIPQYTYDVYSISGEGTGGTIRPYRGDAGTIRDHNMKTKSSDDQLSAEIGLGASFHLGMSFNYVRTKTENADWLYSNGMRGKLAFQDNKDLYQSVYFRNPGEKSTNAQSYYKQIGDDSLIRVKLDRSTLSNVQAANTFLKYKNGVKQGEIPVNNVIKKDSRDKRSQVITYLNADEASQYGLDKSIYSYKENTVPFGPCEDTVEIIARKDGAIRKGNHLSEIDVLNADGRRYVYGIPAYNIEQTDVTFSVNKELNAANIDSGLVVYSADTDNTVKNDKGKENYFNSERIPAYAHSFLLTGVLSPDYVDVKNDGISEDDLGDAVRFNYSRVYGPGQGYYSWRTPNTLNKANYNEGFKTYSRDDKGTYFFGKKEVWYTHSIESKTMIAIFKLGSDRHDTYAAASVNGGWDTSQRLRKLDKIELYAKSDLNKYGIAAKPIKTVHFEYDYALCKGYNGKSSEGKLTLKKIWFTYNGNEKGKLNPYVFNYSSFNPDYHPKKFDRWGNYKDQSDNPGSLSNADFPYVSGHAFSNSDSVLAAKNAAAWHLNEIMLPAGAKIKVTYEADDYAFIQNKRATQMLSIAGFGSSATGTPVAQVYGESDFDYVFIDSEVPIENKTEVFNKYLSGNEWIYLKVAVTMPTDRWGSGYELVPVYGKVADYGKVSGQNRFWIKLEKVQGVSPLLRSSLQFLKNNLSSKAFPASELGDKIDLADAVKMLMSSFGEIKNSVAGFEKASMSRGWCKTVNISASFIRLNAPSYKKLGGGIRVKKVEVFDNWKYMTNQQESVYGQEYSYRTAISVGGKQQLISSGVASYEPMIGNEENVFRQPIPYAEKISPLMPVSFLYSEMPLGESYFPGASVGYSKVRVRTIHTKAKSANGWEEKEFYTSKDFPTIVEQTMLDQDAKTRYKPKLLNLLKIYSVNRTTVSQGFKVELNDMNGKLKKSAVYAETDSLNPISYTMNFYKVENDRSAQPKLSNTVWVVDSVNGRINKDGIIGKDIELITDFRQQMSTTNSGGLNPNLDLFMIGIWPIPVPTSFKYPQFEESLFRSVATVKVIQRYAILDSILVMDKGSTVSTKNLLYDGETGEAILSRTNNEFNDPIYNFSYPAHWAYSGMGMAYKNVQAELKDIKVVNGKAYYPGSRIAYPLAQYCESGDEVWLIGNTQKVLTGNNCLDFDPSFLSASKEIKERGWVIDAGKGLEQHKGLYLINKDGQPFTGIFSSLKIIRSGKRNQLDASVGSVVTTDNPIRNIGSGNYRLVFDSSSQVINTAANSYRDIWQVDNGLFAKDTVVSVTKTYTKQFLPSGVSRRALYTVTTEDQNTQEQYWANTPAIVASFNYIRGGTGCHSRAVRSKSMLRYDLSEIPADATVSTAVISFKAKVPDVIWAKFRNDCSRTFNSFDWTTATNNYSGDSRVNIRRITAAWDQSTKYNSFATTATNQVQLNSTTYEGVNVKNLIQDAVSTPTYGFMLETEKQNRSNGSTSEINYLSLCANNTTTTGFSCGGGAAYLAAALACACVQPTLDVTYSTTEDSVYTVCRPYINDTAVNPYKMGIYGNWRLNKAYVYYHDRKETDASNSQTNIRREGLINNFKPYWQFTDSVLFAAPDTTKWVWNTAMAGFNKRGFETENYDPLGRYNAGLYGYLQSLPTAVVQNGRYNEVMFDGFEDYGYKTKNCTICETPRSFDFVTNQSGVSLSTNDSHSGKNSLLVSANSESKLVVPVINPLTVLEPGVSLKVDSTPVYMTSIYGKGTGLTGLYGGWQPASGGACGNASFSGSRIDPTVNFSWPLNSTPFPGMCYAGFINNNKAHYSVTWTGKVQAQFTGYHKFYLEYSGIASMSIATGPLLISAGNTRVSGKVGTAQIYLTAGQLVDIRVQFYRYGIPDAKIKLSWAEGLNLPEQIIPTTNLYPASFVAADSAGSIKRDVQYYCVKLNNAKPQEIVRPSFSLYQGSKVVIGGWVKINGADCSTAAVLEDALSVNYDNQGSSNLINLVKTGIRIEGWQRYEAVITVPGSATKLNFHVKGSQGRSIYVDDLRVQPYNSSMKGFVYDPFNLKLMAELDENNYASFYEYDDDGTLIRIKKETEKGIMTIKESRSALIKD